MLMTDAVVALKHETIKTLGRARLPAVQIETLELKNITYEIILKGQVHFCSAADLNLPILNDSADYQQCS
jgi:hypothetical protein